MKDHLRGEKNGRKCGMKLNTGKLALVPLGSEDVHKTVSQLPRHPDDAQMLVAVQLKRKLEFKHSHLSEYIRPDIIVRYLQYLKQIGNVFYQDIDIDNDSGGPGGGAASIAFSLVE